MGDEIPQNPKVLTIVMAVYGQPRMLEKWWETILSYPDRVLHRLRFIIVDDCGDPIAWPSKMVCIEAAISVYRVGKDIPWNQPGARNLGMQQAKTDWCLMLDPDMVLKPEQAQLALDAIEAMKQGQLVKLRLRYTNGVFDDSSPNAYLIHRKDFEAVKGYSESYAGHKGWSDVELMHTLSGVGMKFLPPSDLWVLYHQTRDIEDAMVRSLSRSVAFNKKLHIKRMAAAKRDWAAWIRNRGKRIRFPWTRVL